MPFRAFISVDVGAQPGLVEVNLTASTYDFSDGNLTYQFADPDGFLERVHDARNGATIEMLGVRTDTASGPLDDNPQRAELTQDDNDCSGPICSRAVWKPSGDHVAEVWDPYWTDNNPDETVQGNILGGGTAVTASAWYTIHAKVEDHNECHESGECEALAHTEYFEVEWDVGGDGSTSDRAACPGGDCETLSGDKISKCRGCGHSLTGTIEHDLLETGSVNLWVCAHAYVTVDNDVVAEDHMGSCPHGSTFHPETPAETPHGQIYANPLKFTCLSNCETP